MRCGLFTFLLLINAVGVTAFSPSSNGRSKASHQTTTSLQVHPPSPETVEAGVKFSDVVLPTYLGVGMGLLSYQIDKDSDFIDNWKRFFKNEPKTALKYIGVVASAGLVSVPFFAGAHYLACFLLGIKTATVATTAATTAATASTAPDSIFDSSSVAWTQQTVLPVSLGLASAYISYQVDKDPNYAQTIWQKLQAYSRKKSIENVKMTAAVVVEETPAVATVAAMDEEIDAVVVAAKQQLQEAEESLQQSVVYAYEKISTSDNDSDTVSVPAKKRASSSKVFKLLQTLYFPWLNMFLGESGKRKRFAKLVQVLYLPWLPIFLPKSMRAFDESAAQDVKETHS